MGAGCKEFCIKKEHKNHIGSVKYKKGLEKLKQNIAKERDFAISLKQYKSVEHLKGKI